MNEGKLRTLPAKKTGTYNPDAFNQGQKVNLNKAVNNNSASAQTLRLS
jgi:hypothetical protein